jgi:hypothetical protein
LGTYLPKLDSVNVVTFTDGLDNQSGTLSQYSSIEGQKFFADDTHPPEDFYAVYVQDQIKNRTIGGKPITAYSVGIRGNDVHDIPKFQDYLKKLASEGNSTELTVFDNSLEKTFTDITDGLQVVHSNTTFKMLTPMLGDKTKVRMTFDVTGDSPTSAEAEASSRYFEGTIEVTGEEENLSVKF